VLQSTCRTRLEPTWKNNRMLKTWKCSGLEMERIYKINKDCLGFARHFGVSGCLHSWTWRSIRSRLLRYPRLYGLKPLYVTAASRIGSEVVRSELQMNLTLKPNVTYLWFKSICALSLYLSTKKRTGSCDRFESRVLIRYGSGNVYKLLTKKEKRLSL